ncbi:MAG: carboxypeptidase regulatory-like domain-containing protein [Candidatus Cloacimonadales bacterium]
MKKNIIIALLFLLFTSLAATQYEIRLDWDVFGGECNGFISGNIGQKTEFVNGVGEAEVLSGKLIALGENRSNKAKQVFLIDSEEGYFTFWIKDKFADDDMMNDPEMIAKSKPQISIYKDGNLLDLIKVPAGQGLACKVFTLDAELGEIDREVRYYPKSRIILGRILDAVTGDPLAGAQVELRDYYQDSQTFVTDESGVFIFPAEVTQYDLNIAKTGYISTSRQVRMGLDEIPREVVAALTPMIKEFRIVLTWGSRPRDLDAHLSGPQPEGGRFHIWYHNRVLVGGRDFLDRDDMDRYGPETITIYKPAVGDYRYSVFDYSNRNSKRSKKLSRSGARVEVYGQDRLLASFDIPENQTGNSWRVFEINQNHEIIPVQQVGYINDSEELQ